MQRIVQSCKLLEIQKQLGFIVAQHGIYFEFDYKIIEDPYDDEHIMPSLQHLFDNGFIQFLYCLLAHDKGLLEPKSPEDICKVNFPYLASNSGNVVKYEVLASLFVNAFVNAASSQDNLMLDRNGNILPYHQKDIYALPSLKALSVMEMEKEIGVPETTAGALLGLLISHSGIRRESKPELQIFWRYLEEEEHEEEEEEEHEQGQEEDDSVRQGSVTLLYGIIGLGIAYTGSEDQEVIDELCEYMENKRCSYVALSLGLVCVGSCNEKASNAIFDALSNTTKPELEEVKTKLSILGLGLIYIGKKEKVDIKDLKLINDRIRKLCEVILVSCAYAGTGDVNKIQTLLVHCQDDRTEGFDH